LPSGRLGFSPFTIIEVVNRTISGPQQSLVSILEPISTLLYLSVLRSSLAKMLAIGGVNPESRAFCMNVVHLILGNYMLYYRVSNV